LLCAECYFALLGIGAFPNAGNFAVLNAEEESIVVVIKKAGFPGDALVGDFGNHAHPVRRQYIFPIV
jgi:hypothetical protein